MPLGAAVVGVEPPAATVAPAVVLVVVAPDDPEAVVVVVVAPDEPEAVVVVVVPPAAVVEELPDEPMLVVAIGWSW